MQSFDAVVLTNSLEREEPERCNGRTGRGSCDCASSLACSVREGRNGHQSSGLDRRRRRRARMATRPNGGSGTQCDDRRNRQCVRALALRAGRPARRVALGQRAQWRLAGRRARRRLRPRGRARVSGDSSARAHRRRCDLLLRRGGDLPRLRRKPLVLRRSRALGSAGRAQRRGRIARRPPGQPRLVGKAAGAARAGTPSRIPRSAYRAGPASRRKRAPHRRRDRDRRGAPTSGVFRGPGGPRRHDAYGDAARCRYGDARLRAFGGKDAARRGLPSFRLESRRRRREARRSERGSRRSGDRGRVPRPVDRRIGPHGRGAHAH